MIRGGSSLGRIGRLLVCALAALAATVPATTGAQSPAVDEYTLDIPGGGGSQPDDPGSPPPTGVEASGSSGGGGGGATGDGSTQGGGAAGGDEGTAGEGPGGGIPPLTAAPAVIPGGGAGRVPPHRRTLTRAPG